MTYYSVKLSTPSGEEVDLESIISQLQDRDESQQEEYQPNTQSKEQPSDNLSEASPNTQREYVEQIVTQPTSSNNTVAIDLDDFFSRLSNSIIAAMGQIKVYVVESEITEAQKMVKTVVEQSKF